MKPLTLLFAVVATLGLLIAQAALAGTRLHSNIMVEGDLVTLDDLFTETGALAGEPLLEAPAPGERTVLRSDEIARLASAYVFSPGVWCIGFSLNFFGSSVQHLQMNS